MSATEKQYQTCLPPEAYIKICLGANNQGEPKFKSSVYPTKKPTQQNPNQKLTKK